VRSVVEDVHVSNFIREKSNEIFVHDKRKITKYIKYTEYRKVQRPETKKIIIHIQHKTPYMYTQKYKS